MVLSRKSIYNGNVGPSDAVYHLISATFSDSADLRIAGRKGVPCLLGSGSAGDHGTAPGPGSWLYG